MNKLTDDEKYRILFNYVRSIEEECECPWFSHGAWFNTNEFGDIDMEVPEGCAVTNDLEEIEDLLDKSGLLLIFKDDTPRIAVKEGVAV